MFSQKKEHKTSFTMRETKDQKIERLEKVIDNQNKELSEIKKERKRLNYAVERLENEKAKAKEKSSSNDIQKIKELNAQIRQLEQSIEDKELEMAKKEERSKSKISSEENTTKYWYNRYNELWKSIEAEHNAYFEKTLSALIRNRKGVKERKEILDAYERGELYYTLTVNDEEKQHPIFSPSDLFIQIHPKTGLPLTKENFKVLNEWAYLRWDYQYRIGIWKDYLINNNLSDEAKVKNAYEIGKDLVPLYEHLLF